MLINYTHTGLPVTWFALANLVLTLASSLWLGFIYARRRHLLVKPSVLLLVYVHVIYQWPATFYADYLETYLPHPGLFAGLLHGFVVLGLAGSVWILPGTSRQIWQSITRHPQTVAVAAFPEAVTAGLVLTIVAAYLYYVPITATGLYANLTDPARATLAREESLKLLDNMPIQYAYSVLVAATAPLLATMLAIRGMRSFGSRAWSGVAAVSGGILALLVLVSLVGSRSHAVALLLAAMLTLTFRYGIPFHPARYAVAGIVILFPAVLTSLYREGVDVDTGSLLDYYGWVAFRVFAAPLEVATWYAHHAQTHGLLGVAGVSKLAELLGYDAVDMPNQIAHLYYAGTIESSSAGTCYLFSYYCNFGLASLALSLIGLWLLDVAVVVYRMLSLPFRLPCVVVISVSTISFISADYTTVWVTHGFGVTLGLSLLIDWTARAIPSGAAAPLPARASP